MSKFSQNRFIRAFRFNEPQKTANLFFTFMMLVGLLLREPPLQIPWWAHLPLFLLIPSISYFANVIDPLKDDEL